MNRVIVYGTLKGGHQRHNVIARFPKVRDVVLDGNLFSTGPWPFIDLNGKGKVCGELYDVDDKTMVLLDMIEGVDHGLFTRKEIILSDGPAYVYEGGERLRSETHEQILSGNWEGQ